MNLKSIVFMGFLYSLLFACDDATDDRQDIDQNINQEKDQSLDLNMTNQDQSMIDQFIDQHIVDMQTSSNDCLGGDLYGFLGTPALLDLDTAGPKSAPKVLAQEDGSFVMTWLAPSALGTNQLWFQAFDASRQPLQDAIGLGLVRGGQHQVLKYAQGWMVVWMNELNQSFNQTGILIQKIGQDLALDGPVLAVPNTVSVSQFSIDWHDEFAGMLVYAIGLNGKDGFYAQAFDQSSLVGQKQSISNQGAWLPHVQFGVESWGVAWLNPSAIQTGSKVFFAILNERGQLSGTIKEIDAQAQASFSMTFASNLFALAWSKKDSTAGAMGETLGRFIIEFKVIDSDGNLSLEHSFKLPVGDEGDMILTDLSLIKPNIFGVAWQSKVAGKSVLGLHRVNTSNQVLDPVIWSIDQIAAFDLLIRGKNSDLNAWMTWDPSPNPSGELSTLTGIAVGKLGSCRP
jgi:hypothetical protein